jgi:hypothetical protein
MLIGYRLVICTRSHKMNLRIFKNLMCTVVTNIYVLLQIFMYSQRSKNVTGLQSTIVSPTADVPRLWGQFSDEYSTFCSGEFLVKHVFQV